LKFGIQTQSLEIGDWLDRLYVSNDLTNRFPEKVTSLELFIERKDAVSAHNIIIPTNSVFAENNLCTGPCFYRDGHFLSTNSSDFWHELDYDLNADVIRVNVGGRFYDTPQFVITNVIRPILQSFILPFNRIKSLHGAVLSRGEQTFLLIGRGGVGKTTTALQLMRAGYQVLSDDGPLFFLSGGKAYVLSSLDYLHLTENTMKLFPELAKHRVGIKDHREKFCAGMRDVQTSLALAHPRCVTHCIRLKRRNDVDRPRAIRIAKNVIHRELVDESMIIFRQSCFRDNIRFESYVSFVFELLSRIVQRADAFDLEFSDEHLSDIPSILDGL
jgi:hypothetical protein